VLLISEKYCLSDLFHMMKELNSKSMVYRSVIVAGEDSELKMYLLIREGLFKQKEEKNCVCSISKRLLTRSCSARLLFSMG